MVNRTPCWLGFDELLEWSLLMGVVDGGAMESMVTLVVELRTLGGYCGSL